MKVRINKFWIIRVVFILMCCVSIIYGIYILDQPYSMYIMLKVTRVLLLLSVCFGFKYNPPHIDRNTSVIMLYSIYILGRSIIGGGDILNQTLTIMTWPLIFLLFYSHTKNVMRHPNGWNKNSKKIKKIIKIYLIVMAGVSVPLILRHLAGQGRAGEVIFPVYFFLTMMSMVVLLFRKEKLLWILPCLMIVLTTKRTGLLIIAIGLFLSQIAEYHRENTLKKKWKRLLGITLAVMAAFIGLIILVRMFNLDIFERFMELSEDGGSGRNKIWLRVYLDYAKGNTIELLFGKGYQSVTSMMLTGRAILAHNDYMEILHDYGAVGLILISVWIIQILYCFIKTWKRRDVILPSFCYSISTIALLSVFSYLFIQSYLMIFIASYLGVVVALSTNGQAGKNLYDES